MARDQAEFRLQCVVADYLRWACPYPWTALPMDGYRTKATGARMKRAGAKRGWPDIIILVPDGTISIELKAPGGRLSQAQKCFAASLPDLISHTYHVCRSLDDVEQALESRGLRLRARAA